MVAALLRLLGMRTDSAAWLHRGALHRGVFRGALVARAAGSSAPALRQQWSAWSLRSSWPATASEWQCPAVDAVCEGLVASGATRPSLPAAARCLGEQRAQIGTQLDEARADLDIAFHLSRLRGRRRLEVLDALTIGWAEFGVERLAALPVLDSRSEMATVAYLRLRLRELYREAALTARDVATSHLLVVVETEHTDQRLVAEARLTTLHSALEYAFLGGESIVAVTPRRVVALAANDEPRLAESLARLRGELRTALAEGRLPAFRCWRQPLPSDVADLSLSLLGVLD
jgi:hypothetical protein